MQAHARLVNDLTALFRDKLFIDVPSADTDLVDSGLLDSLQLVQLLVHVENELGHRLPLDEIGLDDLRSLGRMARVIAARSELAKAA